MSFPPSFNNFKTLCHGLVCYDVSYRTFVKYTEPNPFNVKLIFIVYEHSISFINFPSGCLKMSFYVYFPTSTLTGIIQSR